MFLLHIRTHSIPKNFPSLFLLEIKMKDFYVQGAGGGGVTLMEVFHKKRLITFL
jgi:hypothetical protein